MGSPIPHSRFMYRGLGFKSSRPTCSRGIFFRMKRKQPSPETAWEITVAQAVPATPIGITSTSRKSRPMLSSEAATRKNTGVRLSPTARSSPARTL